MMIYVPLSFQVRHFEGVIILVSYTLHLPANNAVMLIVLHLKEDVYKNHIALDLLYYLSLYNLLCLFTKTSLAVFGQLAQENSKKLNRSFSSIGRELNRNNNVPAKPAHSFLKFFERWGYGGGKLLLPPTAPKAFALCIKRNTQMDSRARKVSLPHKFTYVTKGAEGVVFSIPASFIRYPPSYWAFFESGVAVSC